MMQRLIIILVIAYVNSGMDTEAIESYRQVIRINPDFAKAHYNLGMPMSIPAWIKRRLNHTDRR